MPTVTVNLSQWVVSVDHTRKPSVKRTGVSMPPPTDDIVAACCCWPHDHARMRKTLESLDGITTVTICPRKANS